ncbi:MAG: HEAT repeat domain-containing protein [Planctomycetes bacterium]|nr:HEAT repeat domain-containing protein [Planctomycetota bacterium]
MIFNGSLTPRRMTLDQPSSNARNFFIAAAVLATVSGCTDGPFFQMKKMNPYIQSQWKKDREKTVVYSQRLEEMRLLKRQLPSMNEEEQARWVATLNDVLKKETSPSLRREAVLTLSVVSKRADALRAIAPMAQDDNESVRLAVVHALEKSNTSDATTTLLSMAQSDRSNNVRLTATQSLGQHKTDEVRRFLASKLEDRSTAMQYSASLALKVQTGKNYGGDIEAWKQYLQGDEVPEPPVSIAERIQSTFR